jgi:hypothetical protein
MNDSKPITCKLSARELQDRGSAWQKLLRSGLVERERLPGGIRLRAEPGATAALMQLVDLERACCAWIDYEVVGSAVTMTAEGDGEDILAGMFLVSGAGSPHEWGGQS